MSPRTTRSHGSTPSPASSYRNGFALGTLRPAVLLLAKTLFIPLASAAPLSIFQRQVNVLEDADTPKSPDDPDLYINLGIAVVLVLLGGAFAGLTIALMGQDETYLQVIATSGEGSERRHAEKVLNLLNRGKHWVLVTLLLSNVITNETLPIVLDSSLGGGWPAVLSSTVLIVIFGEIVPQSVCVRYGLSIGAFMAPLVLGLMYIEFPIAWPTAKLLDYLLGSEGGTMYKKAGLKTLVQLHKTLGTTAGERLMEDEVTIINSVLDLKDKPVGDIMTPMQDVFTMSADTVLDEPMMDTISSQGYSRIPIYAPDNSKNYIGMLLVKILITYDPEDAMRVRDFSLATLPETAPYTSCLDIINFFQEGKSHMVLVSDYPGQDKGALGVVTLEDVIEELIGEEIIDESDVFIDVHKAIRRMAPAPRQRFKHGSLEPSRTRESEFEAKEDEPLLPKDTPRSRQQSLTNGVAQPPSTFLVRRKSSTASAGSLRDSANGPKDRGVPVRTNTAELKQQLKNLGPSNVASKPRATKYTSVKIKPGVGTIPENQQTTTGKDARGNELQLQRTKSVGAQPSPRPPSAPPAPATPTERNGLLTTGGAEASGGATALQASYGTVSDPKTNDMSPREASKVAEEKAQSTQSSPIMPRQQPGDESRADSDPPATLKIPQKMVVGASGEIEEGDEVGEMEGPTRHRSQSRRAARSGSITETTIDVGGMKKTVLEPGSSSSDEEDADEDKPKKKGSGSSKDSR